MTPRATPSRGTLAERLRARPPRIERADARAAVATILREAPHGPEVLFIQRAEHPGDPWSGHMAFPGGRQDPGDATLLDTAVRETFEEIGLHLPEHGEHLGAMDDVPTHTTGLVVRPHVYWLERTPPLTLDAREVAGVVWTDLGSLMRGERDTTYPLQWKGQLHRFPAYEVTDRVVWGLTYRMLTDLFALLRE